MKKFNLKWFMFPAIAFICAVAGFMMANKLFSSNALFNDTKPELKKVSNTFELTSFELEKTETEKDTQSLEDINIAPKFVNINLSDYTIMVSETEITVNHYKQCVNEGICQNIINPKMRDDHPMVNMSWHDAKVYIQWLSEKTSLDLRVPTFSEWLSFAKEHAPAKREPLFDDPRLAWAADYDITAVPQSSVTEVTGSFGDNSLGLYDIKGNVWEWTDDCHVPQPHLSKEEYGCVGGRIVMGQRKAGMNEAIREPGNGSCYGDQPPSNVGLRLVYDI